MINTVDLPFNSRDYLICFSLEQQIYNTIKYTIVMLCNAKHKTQL